MFKEHNEKVISFTVMLFTVSSSMAKEVEVFGDFKSYIKQLKSLSFN